MGIVERSSISEPPYFDGENLTEWKERMKIFIQSIDFKVWLVIRNGIKIPTQTIDGEEHEKSEYEFNDEDKKMMEAEAKAEAKAKHILFCALNPTDFKRVSSCNTAKEMWYNLDLKPTRSTVYPTQDFHILNGLNLEFLDKSDELPNQKFVKVCIPIYKLALKGNWPAAKRILDQENNLKNAAITEDWLTLLHIAAGAKQVKFVKELLKILGDRDLELHDQFGNTALHYAAEAGNIEIVNLMLEKNSLLPIIKSLGGTGGTPIHYAALNGKYKMAWLLYEKTIQCFDDKDWNVLFFDCLYTGIYDLALKMVRHKNDLAFARNTNEYTALHYLAISQVPLDSCCHGPKYDDKPIMINPDMKKQVVFQLVKFLWTRILEKYRPGFWEFNEIIGEPFPFIFHAAELGNFGFLSEIISAYPSLIYHTDVNQRTILHIAILHRQESIFNLIHEIGHMKRTISEYQDYHQNTVLHMAAKLLPQVKLDQLASGAAFQMSFELLWFEKVKKIMKPLSIKGRNLQGFTPEELFTKEHEKLRENGEQWMKKTAESCMLISTVIATGVFTAVTSLPGGTNDDTGKPNYLSKTSFLVFAISDALALISSSTAILIFLSILVSRYREYDFYKSLPLKLVFGLITLFISIASMMVAFSSAFFITYYHGSKWVPSSIALLSFLPILLYVGLQFSLFSDIISSTYYLRKLSKHGKNMIYVLEE